MRTVYGSKREELVYMFEFENIPTIHVENVFFILYYY